MDWERLTSFPSFSKELLTVTLVEEMSWGGGGCVTGRFAMFHWNLHLEVLISLSELLQRQKREGERGHLKLGGSIARRKSKKS